MGSKSQKGELSMHNKQDLPEAELRRRAREKMQRGRLPPSSDGPIWGGRGNGLPCVVCESPIGADEVEYEVADGDGGEVFRFHLPCHSVWQFECVPTHTGA